MEIEELFSTLEITGTDLVESFILKISSKIIQLFIHKEEKNFNLIDNQFKILNQLLQICEKEKRYLSEQDQLNLLKVYNFGLEFLSMNENNISDNLLTFLGLVPSLKLFDRKLQTESLTAILNIFQKCFLGGNLEKNISKLAVKCIFLGNLEITNQIFMLLKGSMLPNSTDLNEFTSYLYIFENVTKLLLKNPNAESVIASIIDTIDSFYAQFSKISDSSNRIDHNQCAKSLKFLSFIFEIYGVIEKLCVCESLKSNFVKLVFHNYITWSILQLGISHEDAASRKLCVILLRSAINNIKTLNEECVVSVTTIKIRSREITYEIFSFKPSSSLFSSRWKQFLSICETLEENQIHVVQPIFSKFETLFAGDSKDQLQTCWLFFLLRRMFTHESKAVQKEGFLFCLDLDQTRFKIMENDFSLEFLCHDFVELSKDENLYQVATVKNNLANNDPLMCDEVPFKLKQFLFRCYDNYHDKADLLTKFILNVSQHNWSPVPMVYVCQSLNNLSPQAAWTGMELAAVRKIITTCIATHQPVLRKAITRLLISCVVKFIRPEKIDVFDFVKLLLICVQDKVIKRNSPLWKNISVWFKSNITNLFPITSTNEVCKFTLKRLNDISSNPDVDDSSLADISCVALSTLLIVDGCNLNLDCEIGRILLTESLTTGQTNIEKAITHMYTSQSKVIFSLCYIKDIFTIFNSTMDHDNKENDFTKDFLVGSTNKLYTGVMEYISRKISLICQNFSKTKLYFDLLDEMLKFVSQNCPIAMNKKLTATLVTMVTSVFKTSLNFVKKTSNLDKITLESLDSLLASLFATRWCCGATCDFNLKIDSSVMSQFKEFIGSLDLQGQILALKRSPDIHNKTWNLKMGEFLDLQWLLVGYSFKFKLDLVDPLSTMNSISDVIEVVNGKSLLTVYNNAGCLLKEIYKTSPMQLHSRTVVSCLKTLWDSTYDLINSSLFRALYQSLVITIFQPCVMVASEGSELLGCVEKILQVIFRLSRLKPGLIYPIINSCRTYWIKGINGNACQNKNKKINLTIGDNGTEVLNEKSKLLKFLNNSPEFIKSTDTHDDEALQSMYNFTNLFLHCLTYIPSTTKNSRSIEQAIHFTLTLNKDIAPSSYCNIEEETSHIATNLLLNLNPQDQNDFKFGNNILHQLLELNEKTAETKTRSHANSPHHFLKQKIWQNIFILFPFVKQEEGVVLAESLISGLAVDMQASVRHLMEWILTLVVYRFPQSKDLLLEKLRTNSMKGSMHTAVCSYLTVALLLGVAWKHKHNHNELKSYFLELVDLAIPWCMTQHFSVRLYAHAILLRIKLIFEQHGDSEVLNLHCPSLENSLLFADNSIGNVVKNWKRIKENFMMFYLDPILDLSLENVFVNVPRLCLVEICDSHSFENMFSVNSWIPLKSSREVLSELKASSWVAHSSNKHQQCDNVQYPDDDVNMQKKIVIKAGNDSKIKQSGLILIASLIDKTSNLGGLARTCEIFGAEKLIVNSLSCIEDKLFQSLAVTAHKWLKMEEVKAWKLEEYLLFLKSKGYQLIGTEQTEQSTNLADFKFPEKCALLLGNEKEGIHSNLLRLLDCCIEIPQVGVVRSLNVHVSGAIAVWEFSKQNIFTRVEKTAFNK